MSRARDLSKLSNPSVFTVDTSNNVGLNSTSPDAKLDVIGIVSATAFYGDGSNLDGVASAGLGTALNSDTAGLDVIYYTDKVLSIGATITVDPPASTNTAYTQYAEISVDDGYDIIIADGDDLIPDVLGLSTAGITPLTGAGGRIRAGSFINKAGTGAPELTFGAEIPVGYGITGAGGINIAGVVTAASFSGSATGLTGTPDITVRNITGVGMTLSGTLSYEDVTNIDSVGIITAQSHVSIADSIVHTGDTDTSIRFPAAGTFTVSTDGNERLRVTSGGGIHFNNGELIERANVTAGKLSDNTNIDLENGMVHYFTTTETTTSTPNIRVNSTTSLDSVMDTGDTIAVTIITTAAAAGYSAQLTIDGGAVTENWVGGSAPSSGGSSGVDIYNYTIIKTGSATFTVVANYTATS